MEKRFLIYFGCGFGLLGLLLTLILVPMHFSYIDRQQFGFKKNTINNDVDRSEVFDNGRYGWGVDHTAVTFPATFQLVQFTGGDALSFFTDAGEISVGISFMYRVSRDRLAALYNDYGLAYHNRIRSIAQSELRNSATNYTIRQYQEERWNVSTGLFNALAVALPALGHVELEPNFFWLQEINLPETVSDKKLQVFQNEQLLITQLFEQTARRYRLDTDRTILTLENAAAVQIENATTVSQQRLESARSKRFELVQSELGDRLAEMAKMLNITHANSTDTLLKYMALLDQDVTILSGVSGAVLQSP